MKKRDKMTTLELLARAAGDIEEARMNLSGEEKEAARVIATDIYGLTGRLLYIWTRNRRVQGG